MHLGFHGGKCCGIKTIHSLGTDPDEKVSALTKITINNADQYGHNVQSSARFFHMDAPEEKAVERLDRYLAYLAMWRPRGMVEITLAEGKWLSQMAWFPILKERGFKRVMKHPNSNSGNIVHVFYLRIGDPEDDSIDEQEEVDE